MKIDRDTKSDKMYTLLDVLQSDEEDDIENLLNKSDNDFTLEKNLEHDIVPNEKSNNVLISFILFEKFSMK